MICVFITVFKVLVDCRSQVPPRPIFAAGFAVTDLSRLMCNRPVFAELFPEPIVDQFFVFEFAAAYIDKYVPDFVHERLHLCPLISFKLNGKQVKNADRSPTSPVEPEALRHNRQHRTPFG